MIHLVPSQPLNADDRKAQGEQQCGVLVYTCDLLTPYYYPWAMSRSYRFPQQAVQSFMFSVKDKRLSLGPSVEHEIASPVIIPTPRNPLGSAQFL